jgi:regulator of sigma E protease
MGTTILLGIISIGILICVHELGHFIAARSAGITVEVFSIGWGKGILSFNWKGTRMQIGWIPFGGYCKMAGDSPGDDLKGRPGEYYSSPPWKRILVALGGPGFNFLFAGLLFMVILGVGYQVNTYPNRIVLAEESLVSGGATPARKAGLRDGDVIEAINGERTGTWDDITEQILRKGGKPVSLTVRRNGDVLHFSVVPELDEETGRGLIGIHPWVEPVVGEVQPGGPADRAGLREGDRVVAVNGSPVEHHVDFYNAIEDTGGGEIQVTVERNGARDTLILVPTDEGEYVSAGLTFRQITYHTGRLPLHQAVVRGLDKTVQAVRDTVWGIALVVTGRIQARSAVAGPARLIYLSGMIAREGITYFLRVMSYISIAFFIMNLIPFPALDGSHIVISLYEVVSRRKPNLEVVYKIQTFGFILLIIALIFVTMNDISTLFRG